MTVTYPTALPGRRAPGQSPTEKRAPLGSPLTERERQVLELLSRGHSNGDIGRTLYVTEDTVKSHARLMFRRLGAVDRAHAVRRGFELGLLTADPAGQVTR